ncbi:hypothetical protein [Streptomyces sp. NPDC055642]
MFEIDGRRFKAGDRVQFPRAGMKWNRSCTYEITEAAADAIHVSADGYSYWLSRADVTAIGIKPAEPE